MKLIACSLLALGLAACSVDASPVPAPEESAQDAPTPAKDAPAKETPAKETASGSASITNLGDVTPDTEITFEVAQGTLGFNIVVTGNPNDFVGISSLTSPSGVVSVAEFRPDGAAMRVALGSRGLSSISVPQTDATTHGKVETGRWRLVVGGITPDPNATIDKGSNALPVGTKVTTPLKVIVNVQKTSDGEFHGGALDLHVYVPDGLAIENPGPRHTITAAAAAEDAAMSARIDTFYSELERLFGIGRGQVTFHAIAGTFLSATDGPARAAVLQQIKTAAPQAFHVVYTNQLAYGVGGEGSGLLGISDGLPGAANSVGVTRAGIAVASYKGATPLTDAITMLHEMGHFVGLFHSTEVDGTPDLFADTPTCGKTCGKNEPDHNNLMWPNDVTEEVVVSPSQARVMHGSPIYRANPR